MMLVIILGCVLVSAFFIGFFVFTCKKKNTLAMIPMQIVDLNSRPCAVYGMIKKEAYLNTYMEDADMETPDLP